MPKKKRRVTTNQLNTSKEQPGVSNEDLIESGQTAKETEHGDGRSESDTDTEVPDLSTAASDEDSDSDDSDDESDGEAIKLHDESIKRQTSREVKHFKSAPYSPDIFPTRTPQGQWKGGRVRGKKPAASKRLFCEKSSTESEDEYDNSEEGSNYEPHHRNKKTPLKKRRGQNRPYSTLSPDTQRDRLKSVDNMMRNDNDWKLDYARKVFR